MAEKSDREIKAIMDATGQTGKHNWLYSFMNKTHTISGSIERITTEIYLLGYCKQCDQTVSAPVPTSLGGPFLNYAGIPKDGCDWGVKESSRV